MIFLEIGIFIFPDFDQGLHKYAIYKRFWKKVIVRKGKKNPILVYPRVRYTHKKNKFCMQSFFRKLFVWVQIQFAVEVKTKQFLGAISKILWKIFVFAIKKC